MNPGTGQPDPGSCPDDLGERLTCEFERVLPRLVSIAFTLTEDPAHAEDLVQDTFLAALVSSDRFRAGAELLPWLQGILLNRARRHRRDSGRRIDVERLEPRRVEEPSESLHRGHVRDAIENSIARLPARYREVVRMHVLGRKTIKEIAASLERPQSTIRTQLSRGLERVRSLLPPGLVGATVFVVVHEAFATREAEAGLAVSAHALAGARHSLRLAAAAAVAVLISLLGFFASGDASAEVAAVVDFTPRKAQAPNPVAGGEPEQEARLPNAGVAIESDLEFQLRRAGTGEPVVGLSLRLVPQVTPATVWQNSLKRWRTAVSDKDGLIRFSNVPEGTARLYLDDGYVPLEDFEVQSGVRVTRPLTIPTPAQRVVGRVIGPDGKPIEGAEVWASTTGSKSSPGYVACISGKGGDFDFPVFFERTYVWARFPGLSPSNAIRKAKQGRTYNVNTSVWHADPGGVSGRAFDSRGNPCAGALVGVYPLHAIPKSPPASYVFADSHGKFEAPGLLPGRYVVVVRSAGLAPTYTEVEVEPGKECKTKVLLSPGARIVGQIVTSLPVKELAVVHAANVKYDNRFGIRRLLASFAVPDEQGRFELDDVPPGPGDLFVFNEPTMRDPCVAQLVKVLPGALHLQTIFIRESMSVAGRVVDRSGRPVLGARVYAIPYGFRWDPLALSALWTVTKKGGKFELPLPRKGRYRCFFHLPGSAGIPSVERSAVFAGDKNLHVVLDLEGAELRFRMSEEARAFSNMVLGVKTPKLSHVVTASFDREAGEFRVGPLPAGEYVLFYQLPKGGGGQSGVLWSGRVQAGQSLDLGTVSPRAPGTLFVDVVGELTGEEPIGMRIAAAGGVTIQNLKLTSSATVRIPAGRYTLHRDRSREVMEFEVRADEATRVHVPGTLDGIDTAIIFRAGPSSGPTAGRVRVEVRGAGESFTGAAPRDFDGRFVFRANLAPGRYDISAREVAGSFVHASIEVSKSSRNHLLLLRR